MSIRYLEAEIENRERNLDQFSGQLRDVVEKDLDARRKELAEREKHVKVAEAELRRSTDRYLNQIVNKTSPLERAAVARQLGLVKEAIDELRKEHERVQKQLEVEGKDANFSAADLALQLAVHAELIELLIYDGQVEEASQILDSIDTPDTAPVMAAEAVRGEYHNLRRNLLDPAPHYRQLRQRIALCVGDFQTAIEMQKKDLQALQRDLSNFRQLNYPGGLPPLAVPNLGMQQLELLLSELSVLAPLGPIAAQVGVINRAEHIRKINLTLQLAQAQVEMYVRLALTHLEYGEIQAAVSYFRQAVSVAAKDFSEPIPPQRLAQEYIRAIERAQGAGGRR
jgi:tetratricopeptide (TPR) repeat protein